MSLRELTCGNADPSDARWSLILETEAQAIRDGRRVLIQVDAVYAAELLVLAEEVVLVV
jgi:hypothetical protein